MHVGGLAFQTATTQYKATAGERIERWRGMSWHGMARHGTAWHGTARLSHQVRMTLGSYQRCGSIANPPAGTDVPILSLGDMYQDKTCSARFPLARAPQPSQAQGPNSYEGRRGSRQYVVSSSEIYLQHPFCHISSLQSVNQPLSASSSSASSSSHNLY